MTIFYGIGCLLLLLFLLLWVRVGVTVAFGDALCVRLRAGPIRLTLFPGREKRERAEKAAAEKTETEQKPEKKRMPLGRFTRSEWISLAKTLLRALHKALGRIRRKLRVDPLELSIVFAGDDPSDTAQTYGYACAALWTLMPAAEQIFCIPKPCIHLDVDFEAEQTRAEGRIGASMRIGQWLLIALTVVIPAAVWFFRRWKQKSGTQKNGDNKTEQKTRAAEEMPG